ncbi:beta-N-acetylhexosaminidase [Kaistia dalseonensis]|uniref:beta-N-acetylhexosaminidase n=1 Tax=Kaistia dalseonensis TaxID=410840 RepID=A0ABU0H6E9_9HYPH|nr:beta-N-acetylhexosaminidase [Kaistia dalseonensis]MCX5495296.1 beta-N-acetylhexosaminidase [Kaistia dalseonensis]MDQ0437882.1 hexosaminidase [Kaistia dalseonensis]
MTFATPAAFRLETRWTPPAEGRPLAYALTLTNLSAEPIRDFQLCVSGPARIDPAATIEGGALVARLSNHSAFAPPAGFVLEPGKSWTVTAHGLSYPLRHWSDGTNAAYVAFADGVTAPVSVEATQSTGDNAPLKRGAVIYKVPARAPVTISVVPWPNAVAVTGSAPTPVGFAPEGEAPEAKAAIESFSMLADALFPADAIVRGAAEGGLAVRLVVEAGLAVEGYRLAFAPDAVVLKAATETGFLYGLITLGQMLRGARRYPNTFLFPAGGTIDDAPAQGWRGTHLDVSRQFYSTGEVKAFLRILAWNKMNRFHWHLSDDEAWRIEIEAYPALTEIASWRGHGLALPPLLGSGPQPTGGYYTKAAVREIVALATALGIVVVPEIDVPGHCYAMLQAIPELRDPDEHGTYSSVQGFPNNCINPVREETYQVLETIFDELIELFPSKIIHIGADEVPLGAWSGSPLALAKLRMVGSPEIAYAHSRRLNVETNHDGADEIDGSGAAILQALFLERISAFLASRGCITGGWQEAAHGDVIDKAKSYLVGWRTVEASAELAGQGYDIVVSPGQAYYLDMSNGTEWSEPGAGWAGWSSPEKAYHFDPVAGWSDAQKSRFLGVQACIWSEPMTDRAIFDRLVFPRLSAIAETGWTKAERKSWPRFKALAGLMPILYGWQDNEAGEA